MGWVDVWKGKTVGLDTSPLIYFVEDHPTYADVLSPFFQAIHDGDIQLATSTVTLLEVLVHPIRNGDEALAQKYNDILLSGPNIVIYPVTFATAQRAAELRADLGLKTPDAIHVATALNHGADAFLTNDRDMSGVKGLALLKLRDLV